MRVTFITQYFPPEVGAAASRIFDLTQELLKRGHQITVLTEYPHYPSNHVDKKYKKTFFFKEQFHSISVFRNYVYVSERKNFFQRTLLYISFMFSTIIGSKLTDKADLVVATSPPPTVGMAALIISRFKQSKFVLDIRDLWPESVLALGAVKKGIIYSVLKKIEIFLYQKADIIAIAIPGFREYIRGLGIPSRKIINIPNGANAEFFFKKETDLRKKFGWDDKYLVLFSGNHGLAQGLEYILKVAQNLKDYDDILFVLIGGGVEKNNLIRLKRKLNIDNIIFLDKQPRENMPDFISSADVCLVPLIKHPLFLHALPSKMFEYMACERPIVVSIAGEAKKLIEDSQAGVFVPPEDIQEMRKAILMLYRNRNIGMDMGKRGRKYVIRHFNRKTIADEFNNMLQFIVK